MSDINTALDVVRHVTEIWRSGSANSLIEFTRPARVEPIVLIDSDVMLADVLPDVMQSLQNIFAGYYLMAAAQLTTINNVAVGRTLDKLNPNRSPMDSALNGAAWLLAKESYQDSLPKPGVVPSISLEADKTGEADKEYSVKVKDPAAQMKDLANLSVGRMLSVDISDGKGNKATVPVQLRLIASSLPTEALVHTLSSEHEDRSVSARWHGWRSGRLEFISDILLCNDLVDAHRKALRADFDGTYANIINRQRKNALSTIASLGNMSVATASNMAVISRSTQSLIENNIGGTLKDFRTREKIFEKTSLMIMVVIDQAFDRVVFYHRSIPQVTSLSTRDLRSTNKGTGPDIGEILKAYEQARAPSF